MENDLTGEGMAKLEVQRLEIEVQNLKTRINELRKEAANERVSDYSFATTSGEIKLSALFGDGKDLLIVHNMGRSCEYCTLWADGFIGLYKNIRRRAPLVMVSPDSPETQAAFASERGWPYPIVSDSSGEFTKAMNMYMEEEGNMPGISGFSKEHDGTLRRVAYAYFGPGDDFCALWPMFELLEEGPGEFKPE